MPGLRRLAVVVLAAMLAAGLNTPASAQDDYPNHVVKVIVAFPPGSTLDALTRIVTDQMAKKWDQAVVVENISGGGGTVGSERFFRSEPDGYTLMFSPPGPLTINPFLYGDAAPDPSKFVPVTLLAKVPNVLLVRNNLGVGTVSEFIAKAKANPGKITYASQGVGSTGFLTAKLLENRAGIEMVHVPYRGAGPALNDIAAGHVDMMFDTIVTSLPLHKGGRAKILAIANTERSSALPDVPTISESGLPGFRSASFFGVVAPPRTPRSLADKISKDLIEIINNPDVNAKLRGLMLEPAGTSPSQAATFFAEEKALWSKIILDTNATAR